MNIIEIIEETAGVLTLAEIIIYMAGVFLFTWWLLKTSLGRSALADSRPRRHNMPFYTPFIPLVIWFGAGSAAVPITENFAADLADWQRASLNGLIFCIGGVLGITAVIILVRIHFVRGLKGFGLNPATIFKDFFTGVLNLLSVWPLLILAIILTVFFGKLLYGQDFQMQQHEELELIVKHSQLPFLIVTIALAAIVAPIFEEMLFRGLFQTMVRSFVIKPWLSIVITSVLFAITHPNADHWPALFVLSMCIGYAYEKSGSLLRPIFIHAIFNAMTVIATLYGH